MLKNIFACSCKVSVWFRMQRRGAFENFVAQVSVFLLRLCGVSSESQIDAPPEFAADLHVQRLQRADGNEMMTRPESHQSRVRADPPVCGRPPTSLTKVLPALPARPPDHRRAPPPAAASAAAICTAQVLHACLQLDVYVVPLMGYISWCVTYSTIQYSTYTFFFSVL